MEHAKHPWYREPYVWLVILFPSLAVVGGLVTLQIAISYKDGLVVDDYYKQGLEINQTFERDKAATRYGLQATLQFREDHIFLYLASYPTYQKPQQILLRFIHHTRADADSAFILERSSDDLYQGQLPKLVIGTWNIELVADQWRLVGTLKVPQGLDKELYINALSMNSPVKSK